MVESFAGVKRLSTGLGTFSSASLEHKRVRQRSVARLARLWAARQSGVLSRGQLVGCGLGDGQIARFTRQSVLTRLDRGLYLLGAGEPVFESWAWGAVLLGGPGSRVLGRTAAALEELVPKRLPIQLGVPAERDLACPHLAPGRARAGNIASR